MFGDLSSELYDTHTHSQTAVVLENFSIFYNEDDTELNHTLVSDFKQKWHYFDKNASVSFLLITVHINPGSSRFLIIWCHYLEFLIAMMLS